MRRVGIFATGVRYYAEYVLSELRVRHKTPQCIAHGLSNHVHVAHSRELDLSEISVIFAFLAICMLMGALIFVFELTFSTVLKYRSITARQHVN